MHYDVVMAKEEQEMISMYMEHNNPSLINQLEVLQREILQLRESMYKVAKEKNSLSHPEVVEISQLLDAKLNLHHRASRSH
jgi:Na+/phosphate symporter